MFKHHQPTEIVDFFALRKPNNFEETTSNVELHFKKTLKLFWSWFCLMNNFNYPPYTKKNRLLLCVVKFDSGETWFWQPIQYLNRYGREFKVGGWQKALSSDAERAARKSKKNPVQTELPLEY